MSRKRQFPEHWFTGAVRSKQKFTTHGSLRNSEIIATRLLVTGYTSSLSQSIPTTLLQVLCSVVSHGLGPTCRPTHRLAHFLFRDCPSSRRCSFLLVRVGGGVVTLSLEPIATTQYPSLMLCFRLDCWTIDYFLVPALVNISETRMAELLHEEFTQTPC